MTSLMRLRVGGVIGTRAVAVVFAVAAFVAAAFVADSALASTRSETSLQTLNRQVLTSVNRFRAAHGLAPLRESAALDKSASRHSLEMGRRGYSYWSVGENLVWGAPTLSAGGAMKLWISSPPHLANLLSRQWRQMGIAAVGVARAPGVYGDKRVTIITTDFGVRR